jgi:tetratricopeptide (TPR) repeat protein
MDKEGFLIETSGFDSVMYYLGKEMYPDKMDPSVVEALLKNMLDERLDSYNKGLNKLNLNDPAQKRIADEIKEGENEREKAGQLSAWDFSRMGSRAYDAGDFAGAVEHYSKAIEKDPNTAAFFNNRGISYKNLGRYNEAIADYNRAIELKPDYALAYRNRALAYRAIGKPGKAKADEARADELEKKS